MAKSKRSNSPKSVFVVCEAGSHLAPLFDLLEQLGLSPLNLEVNAARPALTLDLIAGADIVCALLTEVNSPNVYIELGYALGLRRPIVVISEAAMLPIAVADQFWIKAPLDDKSAVTFQLRAFLDNLNVRKSKRSPKIDPRRKVVKDSWMTSLGPVGSAMELSIWDALKSSSEIQSVVPQPHHDQGLGYRPDFAVWLGTSSSLIESPVIIEVEGARLAPKGAESAAVDEIEQFARVSDLRTGLVITANPQQAAISVAKLSPLIFVLRIDEFQRLLAAGRLVETLAFERNRFAHSAT